MIPALQYIELYLNCIEILDGRNPNKRVHGDEKINSFVLVLKGHLKMKAALTNKLDKYFLVEQTI